MKITFNKKNEELLYPITLTREGEDIFCAGFTLKEILAVSIKSKINIDISIPSTTIPSISNMNKIQTFLNLGESGEVNNLDEFKFPHDIILWHKRLSKENLKLKSTFKKYKEIRKGIFIASNVKISQFALLDSTRGPIIIDNDSRVEHFTTIYGPCYIGEGNLIKDHAKIVNLCSEKSCELGGEIDSCVFLRFSSKQHYGFLGESFIGSWVNIGAGSTNSDLKNTYGNIKVVDGKNNPVDTGEQFLGCVIGDYSKISICSRIYTGKIIGVNSFVYEKVISNIPSFVNYTQFIDIKNSEFRLDKSLEIQRKIFSRRGKEPLEFDTEILKHAFEITQINRNKFLNQKV